MSLPPTDTQLIPPPTRKAVLLQIRSAYESIRSHLAGQPNVRIQELWTEWDQKFRELHEQAKLQPEVPVSLVGGTGAGKSSLINAIVGARLLPVSNNRACTSAVTEVGFTAGEYHARVEFIAREEWTREVAEIQQQLLDLRGDTDGVESCDLRIQAESIIRDKLWPLYRRDDDDITQFDPFQLTEHPEVTEYLDQGATEFGSSDLKDFRSHIGQFLESNKRFWPIVKAVSIRGPFNALSDGVKLIDLPGVNDPNEAREAVTKRHLKTCRFVWIVFNIKRALTKDTLSLMQSEDFLRQIVMDGRTDALTFVGTAADDIDEQAAIDEFQLDEDASNAEIIARRNGAVCGIVCEELEHLARKLAEMAREQKGHAEKLASRLKGSQIFTVSAREFLILSGLGANATTKLSNVADTQIPRLREHLIRMCEAHGIRAHAAALHQQLQNLLSEIKRVLETHYAALKNQRDLGERQRKELGAAVAAARSFLDHELDDIRERFVQALDSSQETLVERVERAVERAENQLEQTYQRWGRLHWATLKAVCRRGGVHVGSGGRSDFAADLAEPILNTIAFAWSDYFGEKLQTVLQRWTDHLSQLVAVYRQRLSESLNNVGDLPEGVLPALERNFDSTLRILKELLAQSKEKVAKRILEVQRSLYEKIPQQVHANLGPALNRAADEKGTGMKHRMIDIISQYASGISSTMFGDARDAILIGVRGLNDAMQRDYQSMTEAVVRAVEVANENLAIGLPPQASSDADEESAAFESCQALVEILLITNVAS